MGYAIKEVFKTLQGEGANIGKTAVFCRFSGCNLWSGREEDRPSAVCAFCDTDFRGTNGVNGGHYQYAYQVADVIEEVWGIPTYEDRLVVFTGGEPILQLDYRLLLEVKKRGFVTAVETNGTLRIPEGIDWVCVSPKAGAPLVVTSGNELKVVFPQNGIDYKKLEELDFNFFWIQPKYGQEISANTSEAVDYCLNHPKWRLSIQTHKIIGMP